MASSATETLDTTTGELRILVPADGWFEGADFLDSPPLDSPPLDSLAHDLAAKWPELNWLAGYRVRVLWKRKGGEKSGRATLGKCSVPSGVARHFVPADWVVWLAAEHVRTRRFTPQQIEALLYHELLHCVEKGDEDEPKPGIVGHDLEIFLREVERYGTWERGLEQAQAVFQHVALPGFENGALP